MKGQTKLTVELVAIGIAAIVMLVILFPPIRELIFGAGIAGQCRFSMLLSAGVAKATFGIEDIPPECESQKVLINKRALDNVIRINRPKNWMERYAVSKKGMPEYRLREIYDPDNENAEYRWALSKIIADELNDCRETVWADLKLREGDFGSTALSSQEKVWCFVCSRMTLDEEAKNAIRQGNLGFKDFLKAHSPKGTAKTYWDALYDVIAVQLGMTETEMGFVAALVGGITPTIAQTAADIDLNKLLRSARLSQEDKVKQTIMHSIAIRTGLLKREPVAVVYVHYRLAREDLRFVTLFEYDQLTKKPISEVAAGRFLGIGGVEEKKCEVIVD